MIGRCRSITTRIGGVNDSSPPSRKDELRESPEEFCADYRRRLRERRSLGLGVLDLGLAELRGARPSERLSEVFVDLTGGGSVGV